MRCVLWAVAGVLIGIAGLSGARAEGQTPNTVWPGSITRVETFSGTRGSAQVTYQRTERWTNFEVRSGDPEAAFFNTSWTVELRGREVTDRCTRTILARGTAPYDALTFEVNPLDERSYRVYSSGTGEVPSVTGTMTEVCRDGAGTLPHEVAASWLAPAAFAIPRELLPPGVDAAALGPEIPSAIAGTLDPKRPNLVRGSATHRTDEGVTVAVTWSLSRSADCGDESEAKALVRRESERARVHESATANAPEPAAAPRERGAPAHISSNAPLSPSSVAGALNSTAGGADRILLREPAGGDAGALRRFAVRLSADGRRLPSLAAIQREIDTTCVPPGSFEAAPILLLGAVQWVGDEFRVTARTVDTETGVVKQAVGDRGRGGSAELQVALEGVFRHLGVR